MPAIDLELLIAPPAEGGGAPTPVTVTIVSPSTPGQITRGTRLLFTVDYTPPAVLSRCIVYVRYTETGASQVVYVDGEFFPGYDGSSTVEASAGSLAFDIAPDAGWLGSPQLYVHAQTDLGGST